MSEPEKPEKPSAEEQPGEPQPAEEQGLLPEIDFGTFIMSLATSAMIQLGEDADGEPTPADLPLAKQTIEIVGMLRDKTRGNLTVDEATLVESILYDLRLRFIEAHRKARR